MPRRVALPPHLTLASIAAILVGALAACSGAETQDVLAKNTSSSASSSSGSSSGSDDKTPKSSSGNNNSSNGSTPKPSTECKQESESNDEPKDANPLDPFVCGTLSGKDEVDHLAFRLKPATRTMALNFTGKVRLRVSVEGKDTTELTPDSAGPIPFVRDQRYTVQITPLSNSGSSNIAWTVTLVEE